MAEAQVILGLKSLRLFGAYDAAKKMWRRDMPSPFGDSITVYEDPNKAGNGKEIAFVKPSRALLSSISEPFRAHTHALTNSIVCPRARTLSLAPSPRCIELIDLKK